MYWKHLSLFVLLVNPTNNRFITVKHIMNIVYTYQNKSRIRERKKKKLNLPNIVLLTNIQPMKK